MKGAAWWRRPLAATLLGVFLVALALSGRQAFGPHWHFDPTSSRDTHHLANLYERWAHHIHGGTFPLWFPEFQGGFPVASAWMYGLFYPGNAPFLLLPAENAWAWTWILHLVLAAWGMYAFLRVMVEDEQAASAGAILFALGEFLVARSLYGHLNLVLPMAWVPWVLRGVVACVRGESRAWARLGLAAGMGLLAGHVQVWFYAGPLAAAFALVELRRSPRPGSAAGRLAAGAGLGLGIAAIQWMSAAELFLLAEPPSLPASELLPVSLPPNALSTVLVPGLLGRPPDAFFGRHEFAHEFVGAGAVAALLVLVVAAGRRWFWMASAALGAVLALGAWTEPTAWLNRLPLVGAGRVPARALILTAVAVPVLAAFGAARLRRREVPLRRLRAGSIACCVAVAVALLLARAEAAELGGTLDPTPAGLALVGAVVLAFGVWRDQRTPSRPHALPTAVFVVAVVVVIPFSRGTEPAADRRESVLPAGFRAVHRIHVVSERTPYLEREGVRTLRRMCHLEAPGYADAFRRLQPATARWFDVEFEWPADGRAGSAFPPGPSYRPSGRALLFAGAVPADAPGARARLESGDDVLLVDGLASADPRTTLLGAAQELVPADTLHAVGFRVDTPSPGWLFVSEKHFPGWAATVDGAPVETHVAQGAFRAVRVPPGRHEVVFRYRPWWLLPGVLISSISFVVAGWMLAGGGRVRSRSGASPT